MLKDVYDHDPTTVSQYDAMEHHEHLDRYDQNFGNPLANFEGAQLVQKNKPNWKCGKDAYDLDPTSVSPYDDMECEQH